MKTLIVSDLHFGSVVRADVLRMPHAQQALLDALDGVDRLVLLGDVLELRHGPRRTALQAAKPFFQALGSRMAGAEVLIVSGNHDHALIEGWAHRRGEEQDPAPLGLEQRIEPQDASAMAVQLAAWAAPARVQMAHPGLWIRDDVYAMHGHYLDAHITVPTIERIAVSLMGKMLNRPQPSLSCVDDYEAITAPIYAWVDAVAAHGATRSALNGTTTVKMWRMLHRDSGSKRPASRNASANGDRHAGEASPSRRGPFAPGLGAGLRSSAVRRGFPLAVGTLNRLGLGPLSADISATQLRMAALAAMGEVAARLQLDEAHVVFGHTHRAGPLPGDAPQEWRGRLGAKLINTGSWTYSTGFLTPGATENPYWPGSCVLVDESGPPRIHRLLADESAQEIGIPASLTEG